MSIDAASVNRVPRWTWAVPLLAVALLAGQLAGLLPASSPLLLVAAGALLGGAVSASVHHAEILALRVGEPFGSIVLAIAVTVIEVSLIVSLMLAASEGSETLTRDTVYSTVMIVLNGIVGLCLVLGGARHHEQEFQVQGAAAALSVLGTLAVITLVLPNYTVAVSGPYYAPAQLLLVGACSIALYALFVFVQTVKHRDYFLVIGAAAGDAGEGGPGAPAALPSNRIAFASLALLLVALTAVVLLAKVLAPALEQGVAAAGLPPTFVGVVVAAIVLMPEGIAAVRAARENRLQTSLNLALGSAIATIGLTIPIIAVVAVLAGQPLVLGLTPEPTVMLLLTLFIGTVTLATGRTTILQGAVHLVIFVVFLLLAVLP